MLWSIYETPTRVLTLGNKEKDEAKNEKRP